MRIRYFRPGQNDATPDTSSFNLNIKNEDDEIIQKLTVNLAGTSRLQTAEVSLPEGKSLTPGLYRIEAGLENTSHLPLPAVSGFMVHDADLLASGPRITAGRDWLRRDGQAWPIVGTTYMASDVHRRFLLEPNPALWDRDFSRMAAQGVNYIRTGIWTGWSRIMPVAGQVDQGFLRALDAFVQTAARHRIVVCFTFFAFTPSLHGGTNPYLDPVSLAGQKAFIEAIVSRYRDVGWIHYDLINEPSYAPPDQLWQNLPINDQHEQEHWLSWLKTRYLDTDPAWFGGYFDWQLRAIWRDAAPDISTLPAARHMAQPRIRADRSPAKALDFNLFTQDAVTGWALELADTIREKAPGTLITLGQDEGGTLNRPSPQFHYPVVDYTAIHSWWFIDHLLWDSVVSKVPEKPCLASETGMMRLENKDGDPWRDPEQAARLLERKFACAFAGRGAGVVEWAWNINPYMPLDNEAVIGFFRPDGTAKRELRALREYSRFFEQAAPFLDDFEPDPVVVILPHAKLFSGRADAIRPGQRVIRLLADHLGIVPTALSDFRVTPERLSGAKLIIIPSPEYLADQAAETIQKAAQHGIQVLITGPVMGNEYGDLSQTLRSIKLNTEYRPLAYFEQTRWGADPEETRTITFDNDMVNLLRKGAGLETPLEEGRIWHQPLPLEYARETEPLLALLSAALEAAGVETNPSDIPITTRILRTRTHALIICINETSQPVERLINSGSHQLRIPVEAGRTRLVIVERKTGQTPVVSSGKPVVTAPVG